MKSAPTNYEPTPDEIRDFISLVFALGEKAGHGQIEIPAAMERYIPHVPGLSMTGRRTNERGWLVFDWRYTK